MVREQRSHMPRGQRVNTIKQKQYCNKFNKDFKNGPGHKNLKKKKKIQQLKANEILRIVNLMETESRRVVGRGWGGEMRSCCLMGTEFISQNENSSVDGWW